MFTFCSTENWQDPEFDFDWCADYNGLYRTSDEARSCAIKKYGKGNFVVIELE